MSTRSTPMLAPDVYSLGCSFYYLLNGKATYDGETVAAKLLAHHTQPIPDLRPARPDVPEQLDAVFKKMVAKKPEERYQTMTEVIAALAACSAPPASSPSVPNSVATAARNPIH